MSAPLLQPWVLLAVGPHTWDARLSLLLLTMAVLLSGAPRGVRHTVPLWGDHSAVVGLN